MPERENTMKKAILCILLALTVALPTMLTSCKNGNDDPKIFETDPIDNGGNSDNTQKEDKTGDIELPRVKF